MEFVQLDFGLALVQNFLTMFPFDDNIYSVPLYIGKMKFPLFFHKFLENFCGKGGFTPMGGVDTIEWSDFDCKGGSVCR